MKLLAQNEKKKKLAKSRADSSGLHADDYKDVYENLSDELHYWRSNLSYDEGWLDEICTEKRDDEE